MNKLANLIAIHVPVAAKMKQDNINERAGLMAVGRGRGAKIVHQLTGSITKDFNSVLNNHGIGFTGKQISEACHYSGGHPHLRSVADQNQADALNRIFQTIDKTNRFELLANRDLKIFKIYDVGAKFTKIANLIKRMTQIRFDSLVYKLKDDLTQVRRTAAINWMSTARLHFEAQNFDAMPHRTRGGLLGIYEYLATVIDDGITVIEPNVNLGGVPVRVVIKAR